MPEERSITAILFLPCNFCLVGTRLQLDGFTPKQVVELNHRYGSTLQLIRELIYWLRGAGVITGDSARDAAIRCDLYKRYLLANL